MSYLTNLLDQYAVGPDVEEIFRFERERIQNELTNNWKIASLRFYYGGSFIKRTMISEADDLDIIVYFPSTDRFTVRQLYEAVEGRLQRNGFSTRRHNVAIRLPYEHFHIDVVPGRAKDSTYRYATLYASEKDTTKQTSLKINIDLVRNGQAQDVIKILKLWRHRHGVPIRSLAIELATDQALFKTGTRAWRTVSGKCSAGFAIPLLPPGLLILQTLTIFSRMTSLHRIRPQLLLLRLVWCPINNFIHRTEFSLSRLLEKRSRRAKEFIKLFAGRHTSSRLQRNWRDVVW
jgi:hypothetical protein